jgi:hypothetical protein
MACATAIEMLFSVTDHTQHQVPRQWAIDLFEAKRKPTDKCNPDIVFQWVASFFTFTFISNF